MKSKNTGMFLIGKIHRLSGRLFGGFLKSRGLAVINPAQGRILFALWRRPDAPIQELSEATQLKKSTLTSMLDRLEKTGYLTRLPSENDRRKVLIKLTRKSNALKKAYLSASEEMKLRFYEGFNSREVNNFENSLRRVLENLSRLERSWGKQP